MPDCVQPQPVFLEDCHTGVSIELVAGTHVATSDLHNRLLKGRRLHVVELLEVLVSEIVVLEPFLDSLLGEVDGQALKKAEEIGELLPRDRVRLIWVQQRPERLDHLIVAGVLREHEEDKQEHACAIVVRRLGLEESPVIRQVHIGVDRTEFGVGEERQVTIRVLQLSENGRVEALVLELVYSDVASVAVPPDLDFEVYVVPVGKNDLKIVLVQVALDVGEGLVVVVLNKVLKSKCQHFLLVHERVNRRSLGLADELCS